MRSITRNPMRAAERGVETGIEGVSMRSITRNPMRAEAVSYPFSVTAEGLNALHNAQPDAGYSTSTDCEDTNPMSQCAP